jgi:uncharacterized protein (DUF362 family)
MGGALLSACSKDNPTDPGSNDPVIPDLPASSQVAVGEVKMYDFNTLKNKMTEMMDALGGFGDLIKSGDTVGMKINLTGGTGSAQEWQGRTGVGAIDSYWTHPLVMQAIGQLAIDAGAGRIVIMESYYDWESVARYGFKTVADKLGAEILQINQAAPYSGFTKRSTGSRGIIYNELYQNAIFDELDCFISLPKAKQHVSAGVTHAMKNLVGTLPASQYGQNGSSTRQAIHNHSDKLDKNQNSNLCRVVLDLNSANKIHLAVNDAIKTTIGGEGPWCGTMQNRIFNKLIISKDVVAADTISTQVIGFDPTAADYTDTWALPSTPCINYLKEAQRIKLGNSDLDKIEVINV